MTDTYKRIDDNTLAVTTTIDKTKFLNDKEWCEKEIARIQQALNEINAKLNILTKPILGEPK